MRLIGAGLPRTATLSQKAALEMLGLTPCHHMVSVFADLPQAEQWRRAFEGDLSPAEILEGHPAAIDWPSSYFYKELMEAFPDAKVLLSVRDGAAWAKSMRNTIWGMFYDDKLSRHISAARSCVDPLWADWMETLKEMWRVTGLLDGEATTDAWMADAMERHNETVKATVPADRLLVWAPSDGWEPLCALLELPVPDVPFPQVHDSAQFDRNIIEASLAVIQKSL
jgi:hypothetical protein